MAARVPAGGRRERRTRWLVLGVLVLGLALWEAGAAVGLVPAFFLPPPSRVLRALVALAASGELWRHTSATLLRVGEGVLLGCVPAGVIGLAMGWWPRMRTALDPLVSALHPLPKVALLPLFMVLFGIGELSKVVAIAVAAFFPTLLNAMAGVRQINPQLFEVARCYGASRRKVFTRVVLPGSMPMLLMGVRLSLNIAIMITIAVELVAARSGLGTLIWLAWETMRTEQLYVGIVVIAGIGVVLTALLNLAGRKLLPWAKEV